MITSRQYFDRFIDSPEITDQVRKNADKLLGKVCTLLSLIPLDKAEISSGFRTEKHNSKVGGSKNSAHCSGEAIDLKDPEKIIGLWCQSNIGYLRDNGLYMESLSVTHRNTPWVHLTTRAPRSGNTIFIP